MAIMGKYCKAYLLKNLRQFSQWNERIENVRKEDKNVDGNVVEIEKLLTDNDIVYLQENYVVTDCIFKDENIIFDNITPEWKEFCTKTLKFEIPVYEPVGMVASAGKEAEI